MDLINFSTSGVRVSSQYSIKNQPSSLELMASLRRAGVDRILTVFLETFLETAGAGFPDYIMVPENN